MCEQPSAALVITCVGGRFLFNHFIFNQMDVQKKKLEILDYVFNSKDGCSWNELSEFLNELSDVTKRDSFLMADATIRRMEKTIETIHPVIASHNEAITDLKHSISILKHFCGVSV